MADCVTDAMVSVMAASDAMPVPAAVMFGWATPAFFAAVLDVIVVAADP